MDKYHIRASEKAYEIIRRIAFERRITFKQALDEIADFYVDKKRLSKSMFPPQK